jgi:hypothetical protein
VASCVLAFAPRPRLDLVYSKYCLVVMKLVGKVINKDRTVRKINYNYGLDLIQCRVTSLCGRKMTRTCGICTTSSRRSAASLYAVETRFECAQRDTRVTWSVLLPFGMFIARVRHLVTLTIQQQSSERLGYGIGRVPSRPHNTNSASQTRPLLSVDLGRGCVHSRPEQPERRAGRIDRVSSDRWAGRQREQARSSRRVPYVGSGGASRHPDREGGLG